jgi:hypothetical protein
MIRETTNRTKNTKNNICAMLEAVPARPPNPRIAAMIAITKNAIAQLSIKTPFVYGRSCFTLRHYTNTVHAGGENALGQLDENKVRKMRRKLSGIYCVARQL